MENKENNVDVLRGITKNQEASEDMAEERELWPKIKSRMDNPEFTEYREGMNLFDLAEEPQASPEHHGDAITMIREQIHYLDTVLSNIPGGIQIDDPEFWKQLMQQYSKLHGWSAVQEDGNSLRVMNAGDKPVVDHDAIITFKRPEGQQPAQVELTFVKRRSEKQTTQED